MIIGRAGRFGKVGIPEQPPSLILVLGSNGFVETPLPLHGSGFPGPNGSPPVPLSVYNV
ncbi:hypothetical protein [Chryseobacterium aquaticum]|uniref:hypothetical protein n=1 Tax=Chryseobacterium aquaticum TaxID=452084 RepID=UPI002FC6C65D